MAKRSLQEAQESVPEAGTAMELSSADSADSDSDEEMKDLVNIDFEFFDPKEADFHAIKRLLAQLFGEDSEQMELSGLADLVIGQPLVGTCVKIENEGDPYALLTVLNLNHHGEHPAIVKLVRYLRGKVNADSAASARLEALLAPGAVSSTGWVISERLLNMPPQIAPPMFRMLAEEVQWAVEDKEPYDFNHYIVLSKTYYQVDSTLDAEENETAPPRAGKAAAAGRKKGKFNETLLYVQPEEELLERFSEFHVDFKPKNTAVSDSRRVFTDFGVVPARRCHVLTREKMVAFISELEPYVRS
ncbi:Mss4p nuclear export [Tieghemiomyces parasiticus]|uniref:Protein BCP1 n=1 Tax=Tieghemiomyces parasiticus TaxID=78921 RepID=A0A9W7ZY40_9FUNG|nr:Mss4p nuclear export [Tieghemiomyces parasiticus]